MILGSSFTKFDLYKFIDGLKSRLDISDDCYPLNTLDICSSLGISIEKIPFKTPGLRGMAIKGDNRVLYKNDIILLRKDRSFSEQVFDCGHELVHLTRHRREAAQAFQCFETVHPNQNKFIEWQANEGCAELLLPYKLFIPKLCSYLNKVSNYEDFNCLKSYLADYYNVPLASITLRIENLKYEIYQFKKGEPIDKIELKSNCQMEKEHLKIGSLNDFYEYPDLSVI